MDGFDQIETAGTKTEIMSAKPPQPSTKSKKMMLLIVFIVLLFLGIVDAIVWAVFGNSHGENMTEDYIGTSSNGRAGTEERPEDEIIELSVDDELVQKLWGEFANQYTWIYLFEDVTEATKLGATLARYFYYDKNVPCRGDYGNYYGDGEPLISGFGEPWPIQNSLCVSGDSIRSDMKMLFGDEITLENKQLVRISCNGYVYDAENDEFIHLATGCSGSYDALIRSLYAAEIDGDNLFLYETAGYVSMWDSAYYRIDSDGWPLREDPLLLDVEITEDNISDYREYFSTFKWTFIWNGENYVFDKLERI